MNYGDERMEAHFWDKIVPEPNTGCWLWIGAGSYFGYGVLRRSGVNYTAHRYAYERIVGPVAKGLELDHLCRVTSCCNPEHLEPVTHAENMARGKGIGRRDYQPKTHCSRGHEFDPALTEISPNGYIHRRCRPCLLATKTRYNRKVRAK